MKIDTCWVDRNKRKITEGDTIIFKYYTKDGMSYSPVAQSGVGVVVYSIPSAQFLVVGKDISLPLMHCSDCEVTQ